MSATFKAGLKWGKEIWTLDAERTNPEPGS